MKILIRVIMLIGFLLILVGAGGMDSESVIIPLLMTALGVGMFAFGGYLDSYYEWYEERRDRR